MNIIHNCGYTEINTNDVILSYNDIVHLHGEVMANWEHPRGYYKGPQLDRMLNVDAAVAFYDNFQKASMIYLLPVMPFDCISIKMGFEALCPPGLGLPRYAMIARVLMEILPKILPHFDTQITLLITMTCMEAGNGYDLLWRILMLTILGFDPTIPVTLLDWQDEDIFKFVTSFFLYFRLQAKKGVINDDRNHGTTFLNVVLDPAYTNVITTLLTCINNYFAPEDEGYLSINLCVMGLASQLHQNVQTRARAVVPCT
jgi:hypothetical protein